MRRRTTLRNTTVVQARIRVCFFFFFSSFACEDGYRAGGERKLDKIHLNRVPVDFGQEARTKPLYLLLRRLYEILHLHYHALDYGHLKQYQVHFNDDGPATRGGLQVEQAQISTPTVRGVLLYDDSVLSSNSNFSVRVAPS